MAYVTGWDGGGTKTAAAYLDENGAVLGRGTFGPLNLNGNAPELVKITVQAAIGDMERMPGGIRGCSLLQVGFAGYSNPGARELLTRMIREAGFQGELRLCGDHEALLYGAVDGEGIILISGTGSVCMGRNRYGEMFRTGGWGYIIGDEGSGYAIGRDVLISVVKASDGRGISTVLTGLVYRQLDIRDVGELIRFVYDPKTDKAAMAGLAPLIKKALLAGDEAARLIAAKAARDLFLLTVPVIDNLGLKQGVLAFSGGILTEYEDVRRLVKEELCEKYPDLSIISPRQDAAYGAAAMALAAFNENV